jgi:glycosyltransferase involved in cell wall biosynthesis
MRVLPKLMYWTYSYADAVTGIWPGAAEDVARFAGVEKEGISVTHNPVVTTDLDTRAGGSVDQPWLVAQSPVVLGAGRLFEKKNFPTLLRAFALVQSRMDVRLIIVGEGNNENRLKNWLKSLGSCRISRLRRQLLRVHGDFGGLCPFAEAERTGYGTHRSEGMLYARGEHRVPLRAQGDSRERSVGSVNVRWSGGGFSARHRGSRAISRVESQSARGAFLGRASCGTVCLYPMTCKVDYLV